MAGSRKPAPGGLGGTAGAAAEQVVVRVVDVRLDLRMVMAAPLPEIVFDVRHVRATGDVLDALVVNGQHRRTDERFAVRFGELHFDRSLLAWLVLLMVGNDF